MAFFHDIHESEFGQYKSLRQDNHNGNNYTKNNKTSPENHNLRDCNFVEVTRWSEELTMPPFEAPTYMSTLDLEVMFVLEFPKQPLLYANTLRGIMTDRELHIPIQFRNKDNAEKEIKHYRLQN